MTGDVSLFTGDPAPWFRQRCTTGQGSYTFDMCAGRFVVLYFFSSSRDLQTQEALAAVLSYRNLFDDKLASFFGVCADPGDEQEGRLQAVLPGIRYFWDGDGMIGRLYGVHATGVSRQTGINGRRDLWFILDPLLRIHTVLASGPDTAARVTDLLERLLREHEIDTGVSAPVLTLPGVFEQEFCQRLIDYYDRTGSQPSGVFTQSASGQAATVTDSNFKRRRDCRVTDRHLVEQIQARIIRRIVPEIRKSFQFEATRLERLILACYDSADRGCFGAHRDNTVTATEHRRFAVSINLNEAFEGGELMFPEFGRQRFRPGAGGAAVFSCSLMHLVTPVTAGRRLGCLPFVYDEQAAKLKQANRGASTAKHGTSLTFDG